MDNGLAGIAVRGDSSSGIGVAGDRRSNSPSGLTLISGECMQNAQWVGANGRAQEGSS
jgi:hypothetical protein